MDKKLSIAIAGLALLCVSPSLAGSSGPGWASRLNGAKPVAKPHYSYCIGNDTFTHTAYFSDVITSAPSTVKPDLGAPFGTYLTKTLVVQNSGGVCFASDTMASAVGGKKGREANLVTEKWKIIETKWKN